MLVCLTSWLKESSCISEFLSLRMVGRSKSSTYGERPRKQTRPQTVMIQDHQDRTTVLLGGFGTRIYKLVIIDIGVVAVITRESTSWWYPETHSTAAKAVAGLQQQCPLFSPQA